ncbi:hypothetical protein HDU86_003188 [Geranomyces michiganensis]|nr:hypothetical protein HDU86_003188 [Geranomyces michiganensis]
MKISGLFLAFVPASLAATTLHLAGDSTGAKGGAPGTSGWGPFLQQYIDESVVVVQNGARGGRSSRTFLSDGSWAAVMNVTKPNDIVMLQFGHNDQSPLTDATRSRGVIRGIGEEFEDTVNGVTNKPERVYTFGHYLRTMIAETQAKGAIPVVLSKTLNKKWDDITNGVDRGDQWSGWSREVAAAAGIPFLDMRNIVADTYDVAGIKILAEYFPIDGTHFSPAGANANALAVAKSFKCVGLQPVADALKNLTAPPKCYDSTLGSAGSGHKTAEPTATRIRGHHSTGGHHITVEPTPTQPTKPTTSASLAEQIAALQNKIAAGQKLTGAESRLASQISKWSKASRAKKAAAAAAAAKVSTLPKKN